MNHILKEKIDFVTLRTVKSQLKISGGKFMVIKVANWIEKYCDEKDMLIKSNYLVKAINKKFKCP